MLAHAAEIAACHISRTAATGAHTIPRVARHNTERGGGDAGYLAPKCPKCCAPPPSRACAQNRQRGDSAEMAAQGRSAQGGVPGVPATPPARGTNRAGPGPLGMAVPRFRYGDHGENALPGNSHVSRNRQTSCRTAGRTKTADMQAAGLRLRTRTAVRVHERAKPEHHGVALLGRLDAGGSRRVRAGRSAGACGRPSAHLHGTIGSNDGARTARQRRFRMRRRPSAPGAQAGRRRAAVRKPRRRSMFRCLGAPQPAGMQ